MLRNPLARELCGELRRVGRNMEIHTLLGLERIVRQNPKFLPLSLMLRSRTIAPKAQINGFLNLKTWRK